METLNVMVYLRQHGINLSLTNDDNLLAKSSLTLSDDMRRIIKANKKQLVIMLQQKEAELSALIKKISDYYGGDDPEFLKAYIKGVSAQHYIEAALACFRDIAKQLSVINRQ